MVGVAHVFSHRSTRLIYFHILPLTETPDSAKKKISGEKKISGSHDRGKVWEYFWEPICYLLYHDSCIEQSNERQLAKEMSQ